MLDKKTNKKSSSNVVSKTLLVEKVVNGLKQKDNVSLSKNHVSLVLDRVWAEVVESLKKGKEIRLIGFCTFKSTKTKPRTAMNLRTNEKMIIPEKIVPKVRFSQAVKQVLSKASRTLEFDEGYVSKEE